MNGEDTDRPNFFSRLWDRITGRGELLESIRDRNERISGLERVNRELKDTLTESEKRAAEYSESDAALQTRVSELEKTNLTLTDELAGAEKRISDERKRNMELSGRISGLHRTSSELAERLDRASEFEDEQKKYIGELKERIAELDREKQEFFRTCGESSGIFAGLLRDALSSGQKTAALQTRNRLFRNLYSTALDLIRSGGAPGDDSSLSRILVRASGLFDPVWYLERNPDVREAGLDPLTHFMETGWRELRDPSVRFSVRDYLELNPDVRDSGVMPLVHFLLSGLSEERNDRHVPRETELFRILHALDLTPALYSPEIETPQPPPRTCRIGVFLHLDRPGLEEGYLRILRGMPGPFDLFLSFRSSSGREAASLTERFRQGAGLIEKIETSFSPEMNGGAELLLGNFGEKTEPYDAVFFPVLEDGPGTGEELPAEKRSGEFRFILSRLADGARLAFFPSAGKNCFAEKFGEDPDTVMPEWLQSRLAKTSDDPERTRMIFSVRPADMPHSAAGVWMRGDAVKMLRAQALHRIGAPSAEDGGHRLTLLLLLRLAPLLTLPAGGSAEFLFRKDDLCDAIRFGRADRLMERCGNLLKAMSDAGPDLVLVSHDADLSGSPRLALSLSQELKRAGKSFSVILLKDGALRPEFEKYSPVFVFQADELSDVLKELPPGTVRSRRVLLNTVISGALAPSFRSAGFRIVTLIHEMGDSVQENGWKIFAGRALAGSDRIVMPSNLVAESWSRIGCPVSGGQLRIRPQGNYRRTDGTPLDREECRKRVFREFDLPEGSKLVLAASAFLERRKGIAAFLDTAAIFLRNGEDDVFFLWLGDDPYSVLLEPDIADRMKNGGGHALFPGYRPDLASYMAAADVFFLPSLADPFPTVVLQAADQGTPVVLCGSTTGCADFCRELEAGMVPDYSPEMFAGEIGKLIRDPALRNRVGGQLLAFSRSYPTPAEYLGTLLSFFDA